MKKINGLTEESPIRKIYLVSGMRCAGCAANLEKTIKTVPDLISVNVSFSNRKLIAVMANENCATAIIQKGASLGFVLTEAADVKEEKQKADSLMRGELESLGLRFIVSLLLLSPLLYLTWGAMLNRQGFVLSPITSGIVQFLLAAVIIGINRTIFIQGIRHLFHGIPDMDSLVSLGASTSFLYSTFLLIRLLFSGETDPAGLCFESSAMILTLITFGRLLESKARMKTANAVNKLLELVPDTAIVHRNGTEEEIPANELKPGDLAVIRPGKKIPADGKVISGSSSVDQSLLTGESMPAAKIPGSQVFSGTVNQDGYFEFRVEKIGSATTLSGIIELVREALGTKAPIARLADRVCAVFVPAVILLALAAGGYQFFMSGSSAVALSTAVAVLVISCPCALGLATPLAVTAGTNRAALEGILVKSAAVFETICRIDTVVLDKTGTVTQGKPRLTEIIACSPESETVLLKNIGALEFCSDHPLARAVREYLLKKGIHSSPGSDFQTVSGRGVQGRINGRSWLLGNESMMKEANIDLVCWSEKINEFREKGAIVLLAAESDQLRGILVFEDSIGPRNPQAIDDMKKLGLELTLLSGDSEKTVAAVARQLGIEKFYAEVLPADKERIIREIQDSGRKVAMIGDGINDAPALVRADLGMAIASGTDIAVDSADVILTEGDLRSAARAFLLGRQVVRVIKENLFWAFTYNLICIPLAAGIFYPLFGWRLYPAIAAAAMGLSSLAVVLNSLRLQRRSKDLS